MGESLGVSVSFGKYENDGGLCWEKWSTFSPNKYLEEVGKCSTPGSVAQKKAFFEAHYKKIAAMKAQAEEEDLEDHSTPDDQHKMSVVDGSAEMDEPVSFEDKSSSPSSSPITTLNSSNPVEAPNLEPVIAEDKSPFPSTITTLNSSNQEVTNVEIMKQQQQQNHFHVTPPPPPPPKQTPQNKINPNKVAIGIKKKAPKSPHPKSKQTSAPKPSSSSFKKASPSSSLNKASPSLSKASSSFNKASSSSLNKALSSLKKASSSSLNKASASTPSSSLNKASTPSSSLKKTSTPSSSLMKTRTASSSSLSLSKNKNYSASESRRVAPVSLHLSMSMNSVYSDTASSVTSSRRRSLFMEQMGDKDIVKRAFKTFQNRVNQLPSSDNAPKQPSTKRSQQKTSTSMAYQKENERSRKAAEQKINPARGQTGSLKGVGVDERTSNALRSNERRKEFIRKLQEKSNAREAERSQLSLKSKEVNDTETKRARQKAKEQGVLKST